MLKNNVKLDIIDVVNFDYPKAVYYYYYNTLGSYKKYRISKNYYNLEEDLKNLGFKLEVISQYNAFSADRLYVNKDIKALVCIDLTKTFIDLHICYDITSIGFMNYLQCNKYLYTTNESKKIGFITSNSTGLNIKEFKFKSINVDINKNYNEDLCKLSKPMLQVLEGNKSGLYMFYGKPGTGKSTFIKYLINNVNKKFVYVPANIVHLLTSPEFIELLLDYGEPLVLILEDAETALSTEYGSRNALASSLLNFSDGILGDLCDIQIITTFNTDLAKIDKAALRKGRLLYSYEFKELSLDKTNNILKELYNAESNKNMTLADIYNYDHDTNFSNKKSNIGL